METIVQDAATVAAEVTTVAAETVAQTATTAAEASNSVMARVGDFALRNKGPLAIGAGVVAAGYAGYRWVAPWAKGKLSDRKANKPVNTNAQKTAEEVVDTVVKEAQATTSTAAPETSAQQ